MVTFKMKATSVNDTKTVAETGGFQLVIDEPEHLGGSNGGANPVEYLLAALSGCLNVVGHVIAREMGFELRGLAIELEGTLDPRGFSGKSPEIRAGFQAIRITLKPDTDAPAITLQKWLKAVEGRCPVSDTIANSTPLTLLLE